MSNPRAPLDYASQVAADFAILLKIGREVLAEDHDVHQGELERGSDIIGHLARSAPSLSGDVSMLASLQQHAVAKATVREALAALRSLDEHLFAASPPVKLLALLKWRALPNATDFESLQHDCERDSVDIRRRAWHSLCSRLVAEGREGAIPTPADITRVPDPRPPGLDTIHSSRNKSPPFRTLAEMKPEQDA